jgi:hypothetical protein
MLENLRQPSMAEGVVTTDPIKRKKVGQKKNADWKIFFKPWAA